MPARVLSSLVVLLGLVVPGAVQVHAAPTTVDPVEAAKSLGLRCAPVTSLDGIRYTRCDGEIPSFDGVGLDTTLSIPIKGDAPFPTILMLHGWAGNKTNWLAATQEGDGNPDKYHWNNVWFVSKGYVAVNYTARGFGESCGDQDSTDEAAECARGWTHLSEREFEIKDSQHILGLLVDAGIADPERLASTGGSYGGGQSWLLATSEPWDSPSGDFSLQLAGAVPKYPWTDLLHSLVPNGRADDDVLQPEDHDFPFGVPKFSYITGLYAAGQSEGGRYNEGPPPAGDPGEFHSRLTDQFARIIGVGEPYDEPLARLYGETYRNKSAFYADHYFPLVAAEAATPRDDVPGFEEVPVFSIQGYTDPLFPAAETLQMYRKLKALDPDYPIYMAFGDVGHSNAQNPPEQWKFINRQGNQFLNTFVLGQGAGEPTTQTFSFITECPEDDSPYPPLSSTEWDRMTHGTVTAVGTGPRTTSPVGTSDQNDDPLFTFPPTSIGGRGCITKAPGSGEAPPESATWNFPVPAERFVMLGLPELRVDYQMNGADAAIAVKLWDVPPSGPKVLVDRAAYRLSGPALGSAGTIDMDLFGNSWEWLEGHRIQLQISQQDFPFLRRDSHPAQSSAITWENPELTIPIRQGFDVTVTAP